MFNCCALAESDPGCATGHSMTAARPACFR